jgi:hypothetical protein
MPECPRSSSRARLTPCRVVRSPSYRVKRARQPAATISPKLFERMAFPVRQFRVRSPRIEPACQTDRSAGHDQLGSLLGPGKACARLHAIDAEHATRRSCCRGAMCRSCDDGSTPSGTEGSEPTGAGEVSPLVNRIRFYYHYWGCISDPCGHETEGFCGVLMGPRVARS